MDQFPEWARDFLGSEPQKVGHGLNLALRLRHPAQLPLMLWDVVVARKKIQQALEQLSFLHFARFVPSWDGTALMVITEFDGPLEPYVMDFAIAIGDVFDRLLSYVDGAPPLPVREHPDEFWRFVQTWNRVPFLPRVAGAGVSFPADFDYPLYCAYADKSAIDIAGPHPELPPPALDRPAAWVDLDDVQGNILRSYAAKTALHQFYRVTSASAARPWLAREFAQAPTADVPWGGLTSAAPWPQAADGTPIKPELMANAAFTFAGLVALLPGRRADLDRFPLAFRQGAQARAELNGDKGPRSEPAKWKFGRDADLIHVVLTLQTFADAQAGGAPWRQFVAAAAALQAAAGANGLAFVGSHEAQALGDNRLYFGYVDGISEPRISGQCPVRPPDFQPASSPGEFLLGPDYADIYGGPSLGKLPPDLALNGSFAAMRLLEQDVDAFDGMLAEQARNGIDPATLRARLMGRWKDGQPLALEPVGPPLGGPTNGFDYAPSWEHPTLPNDHEGQRCPVGAHVRRTNPRSARVAGQPHTRRLIRRGMPTHWDEGGVRRRGLLGLFVGASLERQFEFIQRQWIQGDLAASGIRGTQDPIAGLRDAPTPFQPWHDRPDIEVNVPPLVSTRGSLYLFYPGIQALRNLDPVPLAPASPHAAPRPAQPAQSPDAVFRESLFQLESLARLQQQAVFPDPDLRRKAELALQTYNLPLGLPQDIIDLLLDLLERGLASDWVKRLVESFAPKAPVGAQPVAGVPTADIDPADPRVIADPYRQYACLRTLGNLVWVPAHQAYWVLGLAEATDLFDRPAQFVQQPSSVSLRGIITLDGNRHTVVRDAVVAAFGVAASPPKVARFVNAAVTQALARIGALEQFDFVGFYGEPVPGQVFWEILGLPQDQRDECAALARAAMRHFGQPRQQGLGDDAAFADASLRLTQRLSLLLAEALLASLWPWPARFSGTLVGEIACRTQVPLAHDAQRTMTFVESLVTLVQTVLAGFMSMQFLMGSAMRHLLTPDPRPERDGVLPWRALAILRANNDPGFDAALGNALLEARRMDPPVTIVQRYAGPNGGAIGGVTLPEDCAVFAVVASAHRDPGFGVDPDQYHWDRTPRAQLSLGRGTHECVGRALQNLVLPAAMTRLLEAMPELRLCDTQAVPAWLDNLYFRSLQALPVHRCS